MSARSLRGLALSVSSITIALGLLGTRLPLRAAQAGTEGPTFDVSPSVVTTVTGLLQTTGLSSPVTVPNYPLPDGRTATVTLQAFPLWHEDGEIAIPSGTGFIASGRPRFLTQLLGHVKGTRATTVQLRMSEQGLTGFVLIGGGLHRQTFASNRVTFQALGTTAHDPASNARVCAFDRAPGKTVVGRPPVTNLPPGERLEEFLDTLGPARPPRATDALAAFCCVGVAGAPLKFYDVAVETDDELMMRKGMSSLAVQEHVTELIAAVNAIYWSGNTNVLFRLRWFHIFQAGHNGASFDIFDQDDFMANSNSFERINAVRTLWLTNQDRIDKTRINRDIVLLVSGTSLGGSSILGPWECVQNGQSNGQLCNIRPQAGCAPGATCQFVGEPLCRQDKAFAAVEFQDTAPHPFTTQINSTAHELGHLFGAEHAECTDTAVPATVPPTDPIDRCRNTSFSFRDQDCFRGSPAPPPDDVCSVMSVCASYFFNIQLGLTFHPKSAEVISNASQAGLCGKRATVTMMQNAVPIANLQSTTQPGRHYFAIDVPAGRNLVITTQGQGELTLYARFGTLPTTWGTHTSNVAGTANQRIEATSPLDGRWYILMFGWNGFSGVELRAEHN